LTTEYIGTSDFTVRATGALDSKTTEEIMSVFEKLNESGKTIIIVIHDKDIAAKCRRVIEIADGRIVSDSKSK
jgi:ABC-type lipoprotein export system ATPase subunit